jgi:hypothetical protein
MDSLTTQQRNIAFDASNEAQKYLYSHPDSGAALINIAEKYDLKEPEKYKKFAILVGEFILGFQDISSGNTLIQNELAVSEQAAQLIQADIKNFLAPLYTEGWTVPEEKTEDFVSDISSEIFEAEKVLESIQTVRTMSTDSESEHISPKEETYSSVQSNIIKGYQ